MSDYVTQKQLEETLDEAFKKNNRLIIDEISETMRDLMEAFDHRFTKIEKDIQDIKESLDRLTNTVDGFAKHLEDMKVENVARDAQFARLVQWAKEVSAKTGIPMPQL
jgi:archaellum component FlaC